MLGKKDFRQGHLEFLGLHLLLFSLSCEHGCHFKYIYSQYISLNNRQFSVITGLTDT